MKYIFVLIFCVALCDDVWSKKHGASRHGGKIVGGTNTTSIDRIPYQVYILLLKVQTYYQCGGSIISNKAVLTAAHCLQGVQRAYIRIGSLNSESGGSEYQSSDLRIHPFYNKIRPNDCDIGLILFQEALVLDGQNTRAVTLPAANAAIPAGTKLLVSGWGTTTENGDTSSTLMEVTVPTITNAECNQKLGGITSRMVCAGEEQGGKDSCQGDSGGPAVDKDGTLIGVVSFGYGCARPGYPGVYARVAALRSWIKMYSGV